MNNTGRAGRSPVKICHVITDLDTGGAEMMLLNLLRCTNRAAFAPQVISLTTVGVIGKQIESLGVPVRALGMRRGVPDPRGMFRLARLLRQDRPSVIQTWMYHANLLGGLAAKRAGKIPVAWGIHHTTLDPRENKKTTIWTAKLCGWLSGWLAQRIVCCAEATRKLHIEQGYAADKMLVIPNGFDLERFKPDPEARRSVRKELGVAPDTPLIGLMARYHAQKDPHNFVQAAARLHEKHPEAHFLLCGEAVTWDNPELAGWIDEVSMRPSFHLLGRRDDIPRLDAALDIGTSSAAFGEAFPLTIGETMACALPCVVTDVGDSALLVGDTGRVVPPKNPQALAEAWSELLGKGREEIAKRGIAARRRIEEHFSLPAITLRYEELYRELAASS